MRADKNINNSCPEYRNHMAGRVEILDNHSPLTEQENRRNENSLLDALLSGNIVSAGISVYHLLIACGLGLISVLLVWLSGAVYNVVQPEPDNGNDEYLRLPGLSDLSRDIDTQFVMKVSMQRP